MDLKHWKLDDRRGQPRVAVVRPRGLRAPTPSRARRCASWDSVADHLAGDAAQGARDPLGQGERLRRRRRHRRVHARSRAPSEAMAFTMLGNEVFDKIAALPFPTLAHGPRLLHGRRHRAGARLPLPRHGRRPEDAHGAARGADRHRAGLGRGEAHAAAHRRGQRARPHAHRPRGRRPAREEAGPRRRRHAAAPLRERRARCCSPSRRRRTSRRSRAAVTDWPVVRNIVASMSRQEGGGEGAPRPLPGALRDHRPVEGLRRRRAQRARTSTRRRWRASSRTRRRATSSASSSCRTG